MIVPERSAIFANILGVNLSHQDHRKGEGHISAASVNFIYYQHILQMNVDIFTVDGHCKYSHYEHKEKS